MNNTDGFGSSTRGLIPFGSTLFKMKIKIIRKWENKDFTFGQDMSSNIFCKCKTCGKNGVIFREFDLRKKTQSKYAKCNHCDILNSIDRFKDDKIIRK